MYCLTFLKTCIMKCLKVLDSVRINKFLYVVESLHHYYVVPSECIISKRKKGDYWIWFLEPFKDSVTCVHCVDACLASLLSNYSFLPF